MGHFSESTCMQCLENTDVHFIVNSKNMYQLSKIPSTCKKQTSWQICERCKDGQNEEKSEVHRCNLQASWGKNAS